MFAILETELDFTQQNPSAVVVAEGSEIVAARLLEKGVDQVFALWVLTDQTQVLVHTRTFMLLDTGQAFPGNVKKYIGTFLMGAVYKHVVELEV